MTKIKILPGPIFSGAKYVGVGVGCLFNDAVEMPPAGDKNGITRIVT